MRFTFWASALLIAIGAFAGYKTAENRYLREELDCTRDNLHYCYDNVGGTVDHLYHRLFPRES